MYMRVTRSRIDPAKIDEARDKVGQDLVAAIERLPGYQSYLLGVDRARRQAVSVSTWDTEQHARWTLDALGDVPSRLQALGIQSDAPEIFEITTPA